MQNFKKIKTTSQIKFVFYENTKTISLTLKKTY